LSAGAGSIDVKSSLAINRNPQFKVGDANSSVSRADQAAVCYVERAGARIADEETMACSVAVSDQRRPDAIDIDLDEFKKSLKIMVPVSDSSQMDMISIFC
jgi:hypothetical protein